MGNTISFNQLPVQFSADSRLVRNCNYPFLINRKKSLHGEHEILFRHKILKISAIAYGAGNKRRMLVIGKRQRA